MPGRPRLGKIERYLILHVIRRRKRKQDYVGRAEAIRSYVKYEELGLSRNDRAVWPRDDSPDYDSLQVRFSNALKRLEKKGLIEVIRTTTGIVIDSQQNVVPVEVYDPLAYDLGIRPFTHSISRWSRRVPLPADWAIVHGAYDTNRVVFRLTKEGVLIARSLLDSQRKVKSDLRK
jgi:hypothetical protein